MSLSLRPAVAADHQFIYDLTYQVLYEQLRAETWPPQFRDQLLKQQIYAKHGSYSAAYPAADHGIVMVDDQPVGRLLVDRSGEFHNLIDIAILPKYRSTGLGTRLVLALCHEAELCHKPIRLYVSVSNPRAMNLYRRLGFRVIDNQEAGSVMECTASVVQPS